MALEHDRAAPHKWFVLAAVSTSIFLATIDASIVNVSLSTLERELNTSFAWVQWVVLAYLLTITSLVIIVGRLGDLLGKKRLYLAGFAVFTAGSALCGLAPNVQLLIVFRALQAIGGSSLQALGLAILTEAFPAHERGKALGIGGTMVSLGIALGPSLGGLLIGSLGWRAIFLVNVPVGIVGISLAWRFVPNTAPQKRQRFDLGGAILLTATLVTFSLGLTISQESSFTNPVVAGLLISSALLLAGLIRVERRVRGPMIDLRLFRNRQFSTSLYAGVSVFVIVASIILFPFYLEYVLAYEIETIGLMIAAFPIMLGILSPFSGTLSDRLGTRPITIAGLVITALACMGLSTLGHQTTTAGFVLRLVVLGAGIGIFQSPNNSTVMGSVPPSQLGVASGLLATSRNIGQAIGIPLLGTIFATRVFALAGERGDISDMPPDAIVGGIQAVFLFAAGVITLALLVYIFGRSHAEAPISSA
ncbi:MAG: MFS transporter [Chloroflexi bacterium]|nr:MFS transporter [Chloroflexota bacterium]